MSLLHADDFTIYGTDETNLLDGVYADATSGTVELVTDPDPNAGGTTCIRIEHGGTTRDQFSFENVLRFAFPAGPIATTGVAFRLYMSALPSVSTIGNNFTFTDVNNVPQVMVYVGTTGILSAYRVNSSSSGTLLGATSVPVITAGAWYHIEMKMLVSDTVGTFELRVNGVVVLALTGLDTKTSAETTTAQFVFNTCLDTTSGNWVSVFMYIKDFIVWDTNGSVNNNFFGSCVVKRMAMVSDTNSSWATTGASRYGVIDEVGPDDADYISADVATTTTQEFGVENLPADVTSVRGMMLIGRQAKSDGGDCQTQTGVISNAVPGLGTDRAITTAYTYWRDIVEVDPDTGVQFTPAGFDAMTATIDRTV